MSQKCPTYILSKIVTLLLAIITFIILSICMDSYKDYYKDRTSKNKNRWLKYQLTLFFCTGIIIYSFYKISSSRVEYTYTNGKKFSLGFFTLNLISIVAGATLSRGGEMIFYLMSVLSMMLSIYIFYTTMKEFISYNPLDSGNLLTGLTGDIKKGYSTVSGGFSRLRGAMGRRRKQNQTTQDKVNVPKQSERLQMSDSVGPKMSDSGFDSDILLNLPLDSSSQSQTQGQGRQIQGRKSQMKKGLHGLKVPPKSQNPSKYIKQMQNQYQKIRGPYDDSQEMSQMQGRGNLQSQLKKGLHGLKKTQRSQNALKHTRQMQQQYQKIRGSYDDSQDKDTFTTQFDYADGRFGNIRR